MVNETGWTDLINGHPFDAAYNMFYNAFGGPIFVVILFIVFQIMVYRKTDSFNLTFITGVIFLAFTGGAQYLIGMNLGSLVNYIFIIMALELAGMMYYWFFK